MVAVNWTGVLIFGLLTMAIGLAGVMQQSVADLVLMILTVALIIYHWFVIKTALATTASIAIAFVLFNFVLGAMLQQVAHRFI